MHLKTIEIVGFKSFADKTRIELKPGITGIIGPNGCGKCVDGSTEVQLADGGLRRIGELVEQQLQAPGSRVETMDDGWCAYAEQAPEILTLDPETLRVRTQRILAFVKRTSPGYLFRVRTRSGREITATHYHPFFTLEGARLRTLKAEELKPGMPVAMPRRLPLDGSRVRLESSEILTRFKQEDGVFVPEAGRWNAARGKRQSARVGGAAVLEPADRLRSCRGGEFRLPSELDEDLARFLGYVISEGRTTRANQVWFVNADEAVVGEFSRLSRACFGLEAQVEEYKGGTKDCLLYSKALCVYLDRVFGLEIEGGSARKRVPEAVFRSPEAVLRAFLSGLFEGDGCLRIDESQGKTSAYWEYTSASRELAEGVAQLLLRLGVRSLLRRRDKYASNTEARTRREYHSVLVYGLENAQRLGRQLSFAGAKRAKVELLLALRAKGNPNQDLVPGAAGTLRALAKTAGLRVKPLRDEHPSFAAYCEARCEASRAGLADAVVLLRAAPEAARVTEDIARLQALAESDVHWDAIESVERIEQGGWVYDLCVDETHNFVANGFFVHNSNVMDAFRWCIGEMSWKALRSDSMVSVIFAGTARRSPMNMAEVTLTFDNAQRLLPVQYSEVSVSRRIYRSGESEYYLNKTQCRLRDIRELFLDTGIGNAGYAIIDQGGVDFVLQSKPEERRALFEEAAGVSKYKAKRQEALRKLDRVDIDLGRLQDSVSLINEQIKKLDSDARKARLYQTYKGELGALEAAQILAEIGAIDAKVAEEVAKLEPLREEFGQRRTEIGADEARLAALNLERSRQENEALTANAALSERKSELGRLDERIRNAAATREELGRQIQESQAQAAEEAARATALDPEIARARNERDAAAAQVARARAERDAFEAEFARIVAQRAQAERAVEEARAEALAAAERAQEASRALSSAQSRQGQLEFQAGATRRELEKKRASADARRAESQSQDQVYRAAESRVEEARRAAAELEAARERSRQALSGAQEDILAARAEAARVAARIEALEAQGQRDPYWTGAQAVVNAGLPGIAGTVAALIDAPQPERARVEDALGERLHAVVCADLGAARAAIEFLRESGKGRARFLVASVLPEPALEAQPFPEGARPLAAALRYDPAHEKVIRFLLGEAYTLGDGLYGRHWVCGGAERERGEGLSLADLEPLRARLAELEGARAALEERRRREEELIQQLGGRLGEAAARLRQEDASLHRLEIARDQRLENLRLLAEEIAEIERQGERIAADSAKTAVELAAAAAALEAARAEENALRLRQDERAAELSGLREAVAAKQPEKGHLEQTVAQLDSQRGFLQGQLERIEEQKRALLSSVERRERQGEEWRARQEELAGVERESRERLDALHRELAELENRVKALFDALHAIQKESQALDEAVREKQASVDDLQGQIHALDLSLSQLRSRREVLAGRLSSEWELDYETAREKYRGQEVDEKRVDFLRKRIVSLGNVNLAAPEEYEELTARRDKLQAQVDDLNKAKGDLHAVIAKINATTRENFRQTFTEVREHFRKLYAILFEGGEADLVLTDQENLLECGVEIVAQPPGKRLSGISQLSGGEKTLTAIALLFSFFMVRPSPVCMLDEADAALDDANVERFATLLKEFGDKTQFLIVSHNKGTMESCSALYGVTMEESGVTQLISVDFRKGSTPALAAGVPSAELTGTTGQNQD